MKLLTAQIKKSLEKYPLYSQDGKKKEAIANAKFFLCQGAWTWYILEYDGDDTMFGVIINGQGEAEYGYISLKELQSLRTRWGLRVERDIAFTPKKLNEISDPYLKKFLKKFEDE